MRLLITASRKHTDPTLIYETLDSIYEEWRTSAVDGDTFIVVHGNAPGGDRIARQWARKKSRADQRVDHESHPADWSRGKGAGFIRNQEMVDCGADRCVGFPIEQSNGTHDTMKRAKKAGIPTESCGRSRCLGRRCCVVWCATGLWCSTHWVGRRRCATT